jgi:hypothetical protein
LRKRVPLLEEPQKEFFFTPPWILFEERRLHPIFDWSINKRLASASQAVHGPAGVMRKIDVLK